MRREERHHLKENPLANALTRVQAVLLTQGRTLAAAGAAVVLAAVAAGGYLAWQQQQAGRAGELLSEALIVLESPISAPPEADDGAGAVWEQPPGTFPTEEARLEAALERFAETADGYPDLRAGIAARYEAAAALVALGRLDEAADAYRQVIAAAGDPLHAAVARMGLAETHILDGDAAGFVCCVVAVREHVGCVGRGGAEQRAHHRQRHRDDRRAHGRSAGSAGTRTLTADPPGRRGRARPLGR